MAKIQKTPDLIATWWGDVYCVSPVLSPPASFPDKETTHPFRLLCCGRCSIACRIIIHHQLSSLEYSRQMIHTVRALFVDQAETSNYRSLISRIIDIGTISRGNDDGEIHTFSTLKCCASSPHQQLNQTKHIARKLNVHFISLKQLSINTIINYSLLL